MHDKWEKHDKLLPISPLNYKKNNGTLSGVGHFGNFSFTDDLEYLEIRK